MRASPVVFGVVYCIAYVIVLSMDAALFKYYPQTGDFSWGWQTLEGVGPGMAWYGLMANAGIAALVLSFVVPDQKLAASMKNTLWVFPLFAMVGCLYLMKHFFLR
jgi:hypothetical protein